MMLLSMTLASERATYTVWGVSLVLGLVVILVVAALLTLIVRTARQIESSVADIWTVGQRIANNTVHIPLLHRTNQIAGGILARAAGIDRAAMLIEAHAVECPGCPQCSLPGSRGILR
ncbi:MAG: hypothetical protein M3P51_06910 [Chloroflexota bacterium]|nr:hypothetical protein [Chloroflexota bacterium]